MIYITRKENFSAAHKLSRPEWSEEENMKVFGKCANPNWHGHNYNLTVTVKGEVNPETGFVANLSTIGQILKAKVIDKVDHKNLNLDVDFMACDEGDVTVLRQIHSSTFFLRYLHFILSH